MVFRHVPQIDSFLCQFLPAEVRGTESTRDALKEARKVTEYSTPNRFLDDSFGANALPRGVLPNRFIPSTTSDERLA